MDIRILGCNGPYPAAGGACSGYLLTSGKDKVLLDCGPGVLSLLMTKCDPARLTALLLSHGHADHCSDMLALRYYLDIQKQQGCAAALDVYAPKDDSSPVLSSLAQADVFRFHWIKPGDLLQIGGLHVACGPARHPAPAVGFKVGNFGYTGDTNTFEGLKTFYQGVSLLLADGCFLRSQAKESAPHMAAFQAAELAREIGAERLVITHLRPDVDENTLLSEAMGIFPHTVLAKTDLLLKLDAGK